MSTKDIEAGLTKGLVSGYGGETEFTTAMRGPFQLNASHLETGDLTYHDEWLPNRTGGGQEIVRVGEQQFTRLYAGGAIEEEKLKVLGISKKAVIAFLKDTILEQQQQTRLFAPCSPEPTGDWSYSYQIRDRDESAPVTVGKETISYKDQVVFVHSFLLCPII